MKLVIASFLISISLSSCNTTIGIARDMRQAGEGLEKAAQGKQGGGGGEDMGAPTY
jgi:predicted small secreted protein